MFKQEFNNESLLHKTINSSNRKYFPLANPRQRLKLKSEKNFRNNIKKAALIENTKLYQKKQQQIKVYKQTVKSFQIIKEFFKKEFNQKNQQRQEPESHIQVLYQHTLERDLNSKLIDRNNFSIFDVLEAKDLQEDQFLSILSSMNHQELKKWIPGFWGKIIVFRRYLRNFIQHPLVDSFFMFLVFLNTVVLALDGLISDEWEPLAQQLNDILTVFFVIEMAIKLAGLGIKLYCSDTFNVFDGVVVILSIVEWVFMSGMNVIGAFRAIKVFKSFRVLRVTRLLRSMRFMKVIIKVIMSSLEQFAYIALLLLLFIVIFSLIGMQFFGGKFDFYGPNEQKR